jgi:lipopolysaccharide biosynthesis protein
MFALLIHIYYRDSWEKIFKEQLKNLQRYSPVILINLCITTPGIREVIASIKQDFPGAYIITTPNKGKDIGGKLALVDLYINTGLETDYIIFLHDKVSPHSITGERWRNKLFSIIEPDRIKSIIKEFQNNSKLGLVGARDFLKNEFDEKKKMMDTRNSEKIQELIRRYGLVITDHTFIVGMMFWIRTEIIRGFFSKNLPLNCREQLEEADSTDQHEGTYTHSWERIFCWLANDQHYTLKGI